MSIVVDRNLCLLCGGCSAVCPVKVIIMETDGLKFREGCTNCLRCVQFCPSEALKDEKV